MIQRAQTHCIGASNDPRYPHSSVFCFGFRAYLWMIGERRRDVLRYVTKSRAARDRLTAWELASDPVRCGRQCRTSPTNSRASPATSKGTRIRARSRKRKGNDDEEDPTDP